MTTKKPVPPPPGYEPGADRPTSPPPPPRRPDEVKQRILNLESMKPYYALVHSASYRRGHQDARHAAAVVAGEALAELEAELASRDERIAELAAERDTADQRAEKAEAELARLKANQPPAT